MTPNTFRQTCLIIAMLSILVGLMIFLAVFPVASF